MDELVLITVGEAARRLALGRSTIYRLINRGVIPSVRFGRSRRVPVRALARFIDEQSEAAHRWS